MKGKQSHGLENNLAPFGQRLTLETLPPPETQRWGIRRKAEVVAAVRGGLLTLEQACARYSLSDQEFHSWQHLIDRYGLRGLCTTHLQEYRKQDRRTPPRSPISTLRIDSRRKDDHTHMTDASD